jgi:hypothetical protein
MTTEQLPKLICPVCGCEARLMTLEIGFQLFCYEDPVRHALMIYGKTESEARANWIKAFGDKGVENGRR